MKKRLFALCLLLSILLLTLSGCVNEPVSTEPTDRPIITDSTVKIGLLLDSVDPQNSTADLIRQGFEYAHSLAGSLNIGEKVSVETVFAGYTNEADAILSAEDLYNVGVSAVVTDGKDLNVLTELAKFFDSKNVPLINLSSYTCESDVLFSLSLNPEYISSAAATYAMEKGYKKCAVLAENNTDFFTGFAEKYSATLTAYTSVTPTVYYKEGESANFTSAALNGGNYEYLFLICSDRNISEYVNEIRQSGFIGDIMLTEILDKAAVSSETFNGCSFLSKLEADGNNNISTVFYDNFSQYAEISQQDVSAASAYGYDAYMVVFEALKSFGGKSDSSLIFSNSETTTASDNKEILGTDLIKALENVIYYGVTDKITFNNKSALPTYIYVDNIINSNVVYVGKYNFGSTSKQTN